MKKWLSGTVERLVAKATRRVTETAAEQATERAVRKVKDTAREALDKAEDVLFGPDHEKATGAREATGKPAAPEATRGALQKAREEADRRGKEREAADAALEKKKQVEIDDELARMKARLGKR